MAQTNNNLTKIVKCTPAQYSTLQSGGTVGTETGISADKLYMVRSGKSQKSTIKNFYGASGFGPTNLPSGCTIGYLGSAEIDWKNMMVRVKMSVWGNGSGWTSNNYLYWNRQQLLTALGIYSSYSIDYDRMSSLVTGGNDYVVGTFIFNATNTQAAVDYSGYGPYVYHNSNDGWFSIARVYNTSSPQSIGAWGHAQGFAANGFTVDIAFPIKEN